MLSETAIIRLMGTVLIALFGLAFGSFLNVCVSRWPEEESVVLPSSHCRTCNRVLAWWENIPLLSWLMLHGRCRTCRTWIGLRYPLVEFAIGALWTIVAWRFLLLILGTESPATLPLSHAQVMAQLCSTIGKMIFIWLMVALAALDAEHLWLPDRLTYSGIISGLLFQVAYAFLYSPHSPYWLWCVGSSLLGAASAAGLVLLIRWGYKAIRGVEGMGLGDAKLMAMLGAWLGWSGALLAFGIAVVLGAVAAIVMLLMPSTRRESDTWATSRLPLGTFLCVGGLISCLWAVPLIDAYLELVWR